MTLTLAGRRVVNTRALAQAADLDRLLLAAGAVPLSFPCIAVAPPPDPAPLDAALRALAAGSFDWLLLTSANTVDALADRWGGVAAVEASAPGAPEPMKGSPPGTDATRHPVTSSRDVAAGAPPHLGTPPWDVGAGAPARPAPGATGSPEPVPPPCHPERSEGSPRPSTTRPDEPAPLPDAPDPAAREPTRGSPTSVDPPTPSADASPSASERLRPPSPGAQPQAPRATSPDAPTSVPTRVAALGPATADALARRLGWPVAFLPPTETAAALARTVPLRPGDRVMLPQSALADPGPAAILSGRGAVVTAVVAYDTAVGTGGVDLARELADGRVDAVCFTSGSTVRGCLERLGGTAGLDAVRVACIGPETATVAAALGLRVDVVPARHTAAAMVDALAASYGGPASGETGE